MGQSLACCSGPSVCQPEVLLTPRDAAGPPSSARPSIASRRSDSPPREGVLINELQKLFDTYAGKDGKLGVAEIAKIWEKCAQNKVGGSLNQDDKRLIKESARSYLQKIDLDQSGRVSRTEFCSFMLGGLDRRGPFCEMQEFLRKQMDEKPEVLQRTLSKFIHWDMDGDGYITPEELRTQMDKFLRVTTKGFNIQSAPFDVDDILEAVDVDADGRIDLWEFLAYSLGRRKVPVELLVYDITQGNSELFSSLLLGKKFEAIYHTSILAHGKEFWFGGNIFMSVPPMSQHFGPTLTKSSKMKLQQSTYHPDLKCVHLGYTLMTLDEIVEYQNKQQIGGSMSEKFTKSTYDVLTRNCNHYSNELAQVLCGKSIPDVITSQPMLIMDAPRMKVLVPLLNKWLGGFTNDSEVTVPKKQEVVNAVKKMQSDVAHDTVHDLSNGPNVVSFDPAVVNGGLPSSQEQFGQIMQTPNGSVDLRYFHPQSCNFIVQPAPSAHLQAIDPKRPLGFDSIQSIASLAKEKESFLSRLRKGRRQPSQKAARRK